MGNRYKGDIKVREIIDEVLLNYEERTTKHLGKNKSIHISEPEKFSLEYLRLVYRRMVLLIGGKQISKYFSTMETAYLLRMIRDFGGGCVYGYLIWVFKNWDELCEEYKFCGVPTFQVLWNYRKVWFYKNKDSIVTYSKLDFEKEIGLVGGTLLRRAIFYGIEVSNETFDDWVDQWNKSIGNESFLEFSGLTGFEYYMIVSGKLSLEDVVNYYKGKDFYDG